MPSVSSSVQSGPSEMEAVDGIGLAGENEAEEKSNGSGDGNPGLEVEPDVIDITNTSGFDFPKGNGQDEADPDHSSLSSASTSGEQASITNTITSDTIDTDTTSSTPTPTTDTISQPSNPPSPPPRKPTTSMSTAIAIRTAAPTLPTSSLADLSLHSPSSIIGTPFASSSMPERFEYPFPDTPSGSPPPGAGANTISSQMASPQSSIASIPPMMALTTGSNHALANASIVPPRNMVSPPSSSAPFQYASPHYPNANTSHVPSRAATLPYSAASGSQSHVHAQAEAPASGPVYGSYTPAHPKLRAQASAADPPVPPSLARKRRGWNLGTLGRRRSATGPHDGDGQRSPLESHEHGR